MVVKISDYKGWKICNTNGKGMLHKCFINYIRKCDKKMLAENDTSSFQIQLTDMQERFSFKTFVQLEKSSAKRCYNTYSIGL